MNTVCHNMLITGIGGDIGQGIIKCIKKDLKYNVIVGCDIDKYAAGRNDVDFFELAPKVNNMEEYELFILNICNKYGITHIIPSTEIEIKYFQNNRNKFENIKLLIHSNDIINTFMDKFKTVKFFQDNKLPFPKTYHIKEYKDQIKFPIIVKPRHGCGSENVYIVNNQRELEKVKKIVEDGVVQEYIGSEDEEYTMAIFSDGKNIYSIAFRRRLALGGFSKFVELVTDDKLRKVANEIAQLVKLKGSINVQLRKHNGEYIPFEINPRISSTAAFRHEFGFKDILWWIEILDKNNEIKYEPKYKKGIGVKTVGEVFFDMK